MRPRFRLRRGLFSFLGAGLITGASDDDPSGIGTYSQAGAQFGYDLTWTMLFSFPLMAAIQEISARIGRVTGKGIAANIREHYPAATLHAIVFLLVAANVINLGADLGAMGDAAHLLVGRGPVPAYVVLMALICAGLEIFVHYKSYVSILKWLTLALFAYVATALVAGVPWGEVVRHTLIPRLSWNKDYAVAIVAVLGTTISPYLFFWQASEEAEDVRIDPNSSSLIEAPQKGRSEIRRIEIDTYVGMAFSNLVSFCIIVTTAATLNAHGITNIETSTQAAQALRPISGEFAFAVFALGIVGTGLLAVPVLAASAAYGLAEAWGWTTGLGRRLGEAKAFYATVAGATLLGSGIVFVDVDPIKALFWSAVINGVVAVPLMVIMMLMTARSQVMGPFTLPRPLSLVGWLATAAMATTVLVMIITW